jgi:hypothetical protein
MFMLMIPKRAQEQGYMWCQCRDTTRAVVCLRQLLWRSSGLWLLAVCMAVVSKQARLQH